MKKFALILVVGLFALGCGGGHKRPGTCPHRKSPEKAAEQKPAERTAVEEMDSVQSDEAPEPGVSGYGNDPGEETQE